jgi:hypothetical protein
MKLCDGLMALIQEAFPNLTNLPQGRLIWLDCQILFVTDPTIYP